MAVSSINPSDFFRLPFKIFEFFGLWQEKNSSWPYRVYGGLVNLFQVQLFTLFHFFYLFHFENIFDLTDCIATFFTNFGEIFKTINFVVKLQDIKKLVQTLEDLLSEFKNIKSCDRILKRLKFVRLVFKVFLVSGIATCTLAGLVPIFNIKDHTLAYRMHFPYIDYKNNDTWFIILALFQMVPVSASVMILTLDCLPVFFMAYAIGLLEELSERFATIRVRPTVAQITADPTLVKPQNNVEDLKELLKCIQIHQKIKNLITDVQEIFSFVIFVQGLMSSLIFCTLAFMLSLVRFLIILKSE